MAATAKATNRHQQELRAIAEAIPFKVIELPTFKQTKFAPTIIRQPRSYTAPEGSLQAISRFLMERGMVDLLEPSQVEALFTEMHWCGYQIQLLARKRYLRATTAHDAVVRVRGLVSQIESAEEELFIANRRLVVSCVKPFFWIGQVWIGDFLQEGSRALSNAIRKFDFTRGTPFYAYAQRAIQNRLRNFFRDHVRSGSLAIRPTGEMKSIMEVLARIREDGHEEPDNEKLSKLSGVPEDRIAKIRPFVKQWENTPTPPVSLDALLGESDANLYDYIDSGSENEAANAAERSEVWQAIERLGERSKYIMKLRFIEGRTLEETGSLLNLTRARIKQIEDESLKKIRSILKRKEP